MREGSRMALTKDDRVFTGALVLAVALHAAGFAAAVLAPREHRLCMAPARSSDDLRVWIEYEPFAENIDRHTPESDRAVDAPDKHIAFRRDARSERPSLGSTQLRASVEAVESAEAIESGPHEGSSSPTKPGLTLEQLGIAGRSRVGLWGADQLGTKKRRPAVEESMRRELGRRRAEVGLGAGGPVVTALELAARSTNTPHSGNATFLARVGPAGKVLGIDVLSVTRDYQAWARAARHAVAALAGRAMRVPGDSKGVDVVVEIRSRVQLPSGADPGVAVDLFGLPVKLGRGKHSTKVSILTPVLRLEPMDLGVPGGDSKLPAIVFGIEMGVFGDPADIGAAEQRVVSGRVLREEPL